MKEIEYGLSYDDVLLVPRKSGVYSRKDVDTGSMLTKKIKLNVPIASANMDTVTESSMAIAMAKLGGIGIIHRFMDADREVEEVEKVKRFEAYMIHKPYTIGNGATIGEAKEIMFNTGVSGLLVVDEAGRLAGLVSKRDIRFHRNDADKITSVMTPRERLIVGKPDITIDAALGLLDKNRLEKLPLVDDSGLIKGLITSKDIDRFTTYSSASKDGKGRLLVGAAIGVKGDYIERAARLVEAEVDVLVLDVAHGHSEMVINAIKKIKEDLGNVQLIAGNVATKEGAEDLASAGADAVKVGIGPGAACTTRLVAGAGVPQLSAVMSCYEAASDSGIPIIADGGIRQSGDIVKALAAGASTVMIGSLFAGTDETPGYSIIRNGTKYKSYRGMSSFSANMSKKHIDKMDLDNEEIYQIVPEGVESAVPYKGSINEIIFQLVGGLRSGMSYCGAENMDELRGNARFVRLTQSGKKESYGKLDYA